MSQIMEIKKAIDVAIAMAATPVYLKVCFELMSLFKNKLLIQILFHFDVFLSSKHYTCRCL